MNRTLALELVRVTEEASIAAASYTGKGDKKGADRAAVDAMRKAFKDIEIDGRVVIGEGDKDDAPELYVGEELGVGGVPVDIAVDPVEGTNMVAKAQPNALSVVAIGPRGGLLQAPDIYMEKIATGREAKGKINLDAPVKDNLEAVARAKNKKITEMVAIVLDRPRHEDIIKEVRDAGARIKLIDDGDVCAAISTAVPQSNVDILFGVGGAPEGVLAAVALMCMDGEMQGRIQPKDENQEKKAQDMGIEKGKLLNLDELVVGEDAMFAATGITNGDLLQGTEFYQDRDISATAKTHSLVMRKKTGTVRYISALHNLDKKPH